MSQCSLSTDYLKKIGKQPSSSQPKTSNQNSYDPLASHQFYRRGNEYFYSKELFDDMESGFSFKEEFAPNLTGWLKENYLDALEKVEATRPIQNELIRLKQELITDLKLVDLSWHCDWAASHIRGCLLNLSVLCKQYPNDLERLLGKSVIFSQNSGIGLNGQIVLSIEDVRNSWLDLIRSIKEYDPYIASLPTKVKQLSGM